MLLKWTFSLSFTAILLSYPILVLSTIFFKNFTLKDPHQSKKMFIFLD